MRFLVCLMSAIGQKQPSFFVQLNDLTSTEEALEAIGYVWQDLKKLRQD